MRPKAAKPTTKKGNQNLLTKFKKNLKRQNLKRMENTKTEPTQGQYQELDKIYNVMPESQRERRDQRVRGQGARPALEIPQPGQEPPRDYDQLDESPTRKKSKYNDQIEAMMKQKEMEKLQNQKYTAHLQDSPIHVDDQPFNLAESEAQNSAGGYNLTRSVVAMKNTSKTQKPKQNLLDAMERDLQPFQDSSDDGLEMNHFAQQEQKPKTMDHQKCKKCSRPVQMQSICLSCDMLPFQEQIAMTYQQLNGKLVGSQGQHSGTNTPGPTPGSIGQKTDIGYDPGFLGNDYYAARSSHDGSAMKNTRNSRAGSMPFEYAADKNKSADEYSGDGVSSAGGGEPIETSQHSQFHGAGGYPTEQQRQFILEQQSESTQQRPSDAHQRLQFAPPRIQSVQSSLPQSLKDSQEEISATKNQSRYADDSATVKMSQAKLGYHIAQEVYNPDQNFGRNQRVNRLHLNMNNAPNCRATGVEEFKYSGSGVEEFKLPQQSDSTSLRIAQKNPRSNSISQKRTNTGGNLFDTNNRRSQKGDITPYSFADGLDLNLPLKDELKISNQFLQNRGSSERRLNLNKDQFPDDYMLNKAIQRKESDTAKMNPFDVTSDDRVVAEKTAQNRQTSNFGNNLHVENNNQFLHPARQVNSQRAYAQSQEHDQSPQFRQFTTDIPDSDYNKQIIDSARNRLLSSQNDGPADIVLESQGGPSSSRGFIRSINSGQRLESMKQSNQTQNTLQVSFVQNEFLRLTSDTNKNQQQDDKRRSDEEFGLKRKVTFRLTQRQTTMFLERYKRWRESLSCKQRVWQQQSAHKSLTPNFSRAQIFLSILTLTFAFLGFLFYFSAKELKQHIIDYGDECPTLGAKCEIKFQPEFNLENPHIYYELDSFYSNYRTLVTTLPLYNQLRGEDIEQSDCQNIETVGDLLPNLQFYQNITNVELSTLVKTTPLNPCGSLPKYMFTDSFTFSHIDEFKESKITIDESNISSKFDREHKFKKSDDEFQWLDVTNEHFIVWQQQDTLHKVFRLYGRIDQELKKDQVYKLEVDNSKLAHLVD